MQAQYAGLVGAGLWAAQEVHSACQDGASARVAALLPLTCALLCRCEAWLAHSQERKALPAAAARLRDAALRIMLTAAAASTCQGSGYSHSPAVASQPVPACLACDDGGGVGSLLWLPPTCWAPLLPALGLSSAGAPGIAAALAPGAPGVVMSGASVQLCYAAEQEVLVHSRAVLQLQQQLLQLQLEEAAAPALFRCLLSGCLELHAERTGQQGQQRRSAAAPVGGSTYERCLALFRLLHAMVGATTSRQGLVGGCRVAQRVCVRHTDDVQFA